MPRMPLFTIVAVHYQGTVPHEVFARGIVSIQAQTFKDFELLCYHDGPLLDPSLPMPCEVIATEQRFNDFGHSLRDMGIRRASGDYIVHFNADNILYPHALQVLADEINAPPRIVFANGRVADPTPADIVIMPIRMRGMVRFRGANYRDPKRPDELCSIFTGYPPVRFNIDCMQLVMKRSLWLAEGGWRDKSPESDGIMYQAFCGKYPYRVACDILGEHR